MNDAGATADLLADLGRVLDDAGLRGSYLVRDLRTGEEIGVDAERVMPLASLVKVPLALTVLERIQAGTLDGARRLRIPPGQVERAGPAGVTRFRHFADIAVDDALSLAVSMSDNVAADALFELVTPGDVMDLLAAWGLTGLSIRHGFGGLTRTPAERMPASDVDLAQAMAISGGTSGGGHRIPQLDVTSTNAGTARALVDLLEAIWMALPGAASTASPVSRVPADVAARTRELMAANIHRQRLAPDLHSDASRWFSKTGTLLNLRHEIGVVEHADGGLFAIAALTESRIAAAFQPHVESVMGHVARRLRDHLR